MEGMGTRYDPKQFEAKWYSFWEEKGYFKADPASPKPNFTIVIPPPNVTDVLHMGHGLNNTLQDILIRKKRMEGHEALWVPGTDHAGIATQNVVERQLAREGRTRWDLGREAFLERVWDWVRRTGGTIIEQLRALGCSCDWSRTRFTLDPGLSRAVREAFVRLYEKGLIYKGKYIVNWCPRCRTALADDEVEHREHDGKLWYIRYPLEGGGHVEVATTRPETMLGDTAVAVNPGDGRYRGIVGRTAVLPLLGRRIPVVADEAVDPEFGTGAVKVTPAHDPVDYEVALRHGLPFVVAMDEDGRMTEEAGPYRGLDRFQCREKVLEDLRREGLLLKEEPHRHSVGHCYRCDTVVEPYLSDQWFVRMKPLAEPALEAVSEGRIRLYPERWTKVYEHWMRNIKDWCISRQLWWGHRIPVWTCPDCGEVTVSREDIVECPKCRSPKVQQDPDVLDTWFSSWLWPFSTLGWPEDTEDLRRFYPTDVLVTAPEILFFWVARMIMAGLEFMGEVPFHTVLLHGTVRDMMGRKMSKSLGNGIDPMEVIKLYGADALRWTIASGTAPGTDLYLDHRDIERSFAPGRNFANKIWNASRLVLMNLEGYEPEMAGPPRLEDRWIISRLERARAYTEEALESFRFNEAARAIYTFFWGELCDWYLEAVKPRFSGEPSDRARAQRTLVYVMDKVLRLLHPFMPFITEEIWQRMRPLLGDVPDSITVASWPEPRPQDVDEGAEAEMDLIRETIVAVRDIRREMRVPPSAVVQIFVRAEEGEGDILMREREFLERFARAKLEQVGPEVRRPPLSASSMVRRTEIFVPLGELIDVEAERRRLERELGEIERRLESLKKRLEDERFLQRAPAEVVERERRRFGELSQQLERLRQNLGALSS